ncbi:hypothetical protein MD588_24060 [Photobacterium sp. SDRW27]|uniref:hypothetical protein n=1 Tax=Photobacterium obscurum TaxID=2829490 RepID=UPI0022430004|nr:hypothetical protein [Photobacterium obscurum]MCW8331879.1 hypothetical protein [Photobacterium obscurum]
MTSITPGYQTFQARDVETKAFAKSSNNDSAYVYKSAETGDLQPIDFSGEDPQTNDLVILPAPKIIKVVDINQRYAAMNIDNVAVEVNGKKYVGTYTLIQEKETGAMFPLIEGDVPIYKRIDADHEAWVTATHFSYAADDSRIYLRHGDGKSLHVAENNGDYFVITKIFDDYFRNNWILTDGTVISLPWSRNELIWVDRINGTTNTYNIDLTNTTNPFVFQGKLHIVNTSTDKMLELTVDSNALTMTDTGWTAPGYRTDDNNNSVRRSDYEMLSDCSVYKFDTDTKTVLKISDREDNSGFTPAAGQHALFCVHSVAEGNQEQPLFTQFDTRTESTQTTPATTGAKIDATERLVVVSDKEIMFYQDPFGEFTEYYVDFDTNTTTEKQTDSLSVIKMQTVAQAAE